MNAKLAELENLLSVLPVTNTGDKLLVGKDCCHFIVTHKGSHFTIDGETCTDKRMPQAVRMVWDAMAYMDCNH